MADQLLASKLDPTAGHRVTDDGEDGATKGHRDQCAWIVRDCQAA